MAAVFLGLVGCASASVTPLAPEGSASSEGEPARDRRAPPASGRTPEVSHAERDSVGVPAASASGVPRETALAAVPARGAAVIRLLNAGAEPRRALRYVFHQGEAIPFAMRTTMVMDTAMSAPALSGSQSPRSIHQILPGIECNGVTKTTRVDADGTAHRNGLLSTMTVIATPGVLPEVQAKVEQTLNGVGNIPFEDVIDTRGQISHADVDLSGVHDPTMLESMQQTTDSMSALTLPWPAEPVGVGAKWEIVSTYGKRKNLARDVVVTLVSLKGNQVKLETTSHVTGAPSTVTKNGTTINVRATSSEGTGSLEVSLDPLVTRSKSTTRTRTDSSTSGVDIRIDMEMMIDLHSG